MGINKLQPCPFLLLDKDNMYQTFSKAHIAKKYLLAAIVFRYNEKRPRSRMASEQGSLSLVFLVIVEQHNKILCLGRHPYKKEPRLERKGFNN